MNDNCLQLIENYEELLEKKRKFDLDKINKENIKEYKNYINDIEFCLEKIEDIFKSSLMLIEELNSIVSVGSKFRYSGMKLHFSPDEVVNFVDDVKNSIGKNILLEKVVNNYKKLAGNNKTYKEYIEKSLFFIDFSDEDFDRLVSEPKHLNVLLDFIEKIKPCGLSFANHFFSDFFKNDTNALKLFFDSLIKIKIKILDIRFFNFALFENKENFDLLLNFLRKSKVEYLDLFRCKLANLFINDLNKFYLFLDAIAKSNIQILSLDSNNFGQIFGDMDGIEIFFDYIKKSNILEINMIANSLGDVICTTENFEEFLDLVDSSKLRRIYFGGNMLANTPKDPKIIARIEKMNCKIIF